MPDLIKTILISLTKTIAIAALIAAGANYFASTDFLSTFTMLIGMQFVISYVWKSVTEHLLKSQAITEETKRLELYSMQGVEVQCAYCKKDNFVPVRMDEDNNFECEFCGKTNSVYIDVTTTQKTQIPKSSDPEQVISKTLDKETDD